MGKYKLILFFLVVMALSGSAVGYYFGFERGSSSSEQWKPQQDIGSWKTFADSAKGVEFKYPEVLTAKYIYHVDWPPHTQILNEPFTCAEAGAETDRAGKTEKLVIDGRTYCLTKVTEGAAGSIYTQYAYAFPKNDKVAVLTFSLRFVQCGNYDEPSRRECESERGVFDIGSIVDRIAQTLVLK